MNTNQPKPTPATPATPATDVRNPHNPRDPHSPNPNTDTDPRRNSIPRQDPSQTRPHAIEQNPALVSTPSPAKAPTGG